MLFLLSGSSGAGKTAVGPHVTAQLDRLAFHDADEFDTRSAGERVDQLESWVRRGLRYQANGVDLLLASQSPLGELLACGNAILLDGIAGCVLDCSDFVRAERIQSRGGEQANILGMDVLCWGVFHRMHAADPQWEQGVICADGSAPGHWNRWTGWRKDDPRWDVPIFDTTDVSVSATARAVAEWIETARRTPPLLRQHEWWIN